MATTITILALNPMDATYGSTHRFRELVRGLAQEQWLRIFYAEANAKDIAVFSIPQKNNALGFMIATAMRAWCALRKKYDILLTQTITPLTIPSIIIARLRNKKIMVDWDDLCWVLQKNRFRSLVVKFCEQSFLRVPDLIITPSRYLVDYGKRYGAKNIVYAPHGIDLELFDPEKYDASEARRELSIPPAQVVLGFLASFTTGGVKDLDAIFSCVKMVLSENASVSFLVIGGGPLFEEYKAMAKAMRLERTYFTDILPQEQIPRYLSAIDIGLLFMRDNSANKYKTSLKIAEYLAMHKPVVGHLVGETNDNFGRFCVPAGATAESFSLMVKRAVQSRPIVDWPSLDNFLRESYGWSVSVKALVDYIRK